MSKVKLSAPWEILYREFESMFDGDPDIELDINDEEKEIVMRVENAAKADALSKILPPEKTFGNVTVKITVVPANGEESLSSLYQKAFTGNPVFVAATDVSGSGFEGTYVIFEKEVVQFYADNMASIFGLKSMLYEDIANEIIEDHSGVFFCTDDDDGDDDCLIGLL